MNIKKWKQKNEIGKVKVYYAFFGETGYYQNCVNYGGYEKDSLRGKRADLKMFWVYLISKGFTENSQLSALTADVLLSYFGYMAKVKKYEPSTIRRKLATLQHFFNTLQQEHGYPLPLKKFPNVHVQKKDIKMITPQQIQVVLNYLDGKSFNSLTLRTAFIMLILMGLRGGKELTQLKRDQIDMNNQFIKNLARKGKKIQTLPFSNQVKEQLLIYTYHRDKLPVKSKYLLIMENGKRFNYTRLSRTLRPFNTQSHKIRHTFATNLYDKTKDIKLVSIALGHSSTATTDGYIHRTKCELEQALTANPIITL